MIDLLYVIINFIVYSIFIVGITVGFIGWFGIIKANNLTKREKINNDKIVDGYHKRHLF
jgi:hypothetical protein